MPRSSERLRSPRFAAVLGEGQDAPRDALFRQTGVIRAQTFGDLLDVPAAFATGSVLRGSRIAILTSTGGAGTLVSDSLGVAGFETPAPDAETAAALRSLQTGDHAALDRNPIDVTLAGLQTDLLRGAIKTLLASPSYDALTVVVGSSGLAMPELMAGAIQDCLPLSDKPVIAYVSPHAPEATALLTERGVPAFAAAESCTAALAGMLQASRWTAPAREAPLGEFVAVDDLPAGSLDEAQAKQLFSRFGVSCAREIVVQTPAQGQRAAHELGDRVLLKVLSSEITHKSDVGGVAVNLTAEQVAERVPAMADEVESKTGVRPRRFLVQEMVGEGTAQNVAAAGWLSRQPQGRCGSAGDGDRGVLAHGGTAGRSPGGGRNQPAVRAARGTRRSRRRRRRAAALRSALFRIRRQYFKMEAEVGIEPAYTALQAAA